MKLSPVKVEDCDDGPGCPEDFEPAPTLKMSSNELRIAWIRDRFSRLLPPAGLFDAMPFQVLVACLPFCLTLVGGGIVVSVGYVAFFELDRLHQRQCVEVTPLTPEGEVFCRVSSGFSR